MTPSSPYPSHLKENFNSVIELLGQLLPVRRSGWDERSSASSCLSGCIPACRDVRTDQVTNEKERKIFLEFKRICCFTSWPFLQQSSPVGSTPAVQVQEFEGKVQPGSELFSPKMLWFFYCARNFLNKVGCCPNKFWSKFFVVRSAEFCLTMRKPPFYLPRKTITLFT